MIYEDRTGKGENPQARMFMRALVAVGLALTAVWCDHVSGPACEEISGMEPLWTTDLRQHGYSVPDLNPPSAFQASWQVAFGTTKELGVAWPADPFGSENVGRAVVIESASGKIIGKAEWPGAKTSYLFATLNGNYAVRTKTGTALYSHGLGSIVANSIHSVDFASPDGRSFTSRESIPGHGVVVFLDADTLQPGDVTYVDSNADSIGANRLVYSVGLPDSRRRAVIVKSPVKAMGVRVHETGCSEIRCHFVSEDVIAVLGCNRCEVIRTTTGEVFTVTTGGQTYFAAASRAGNRFATIELFYGRGHHPKLRFERIKVIDLGLEEVIVTGTIRELQGREDGNSGVALSPDGSLLAINSLGVVRVFTLPPPSVPVALDPK